MPNLPDWDPTFFRKVECGDKNAFDYEEQDFKTIVAELERAKSDIRRLLKELELSNRAQVAYSYRAVNMHKARPSGTDRDAVGLAV